MSKFTQISTFIEVVNRSSFAGAARHLKITPAAVSKQIMTLESELGVQLLKRSTRRVTLTAEGVLYFEHAKRILEALHEAEAAISYSKEEPSGTLTVVSGPHFGNQYVIPHLKEFLEMYPKIKMHLSLTQVMPDFEKDKVDVVVGLSTGIPASCIQRRLVYARKVLCASKHYLKKYGTPKKPSDLVRHRVISHAMSRPNNVLSFKNGESIFVDPILFFNDTRAMLASALDGIGIVELHDYIVDDSIKNGELVEILGKYMEQKKQIPLYVAYPQAAHVHMKVRSFIDFVLTKVEQHPA